MARYLSILLTLALLTSGAASAEEQGLFHRAASLALGVAAKSAQKGLELDAEKRAMASPGQAEKIRRSSKLAQLGLQSVGDGLIEKATGVDVGGIKNKSSTTTHRPTKTLSLSKSKYPESVSHILDAINAGKPSILTVDKDKAGIKARRAQSLRGVKTKPGLDRDEYPQAMFKEGGDGASVRHINPSDNRGSGACIGAQCRNLPNGTKVKIKIKD